MMRFAWLLPACATLALGCEHYQYPESRGSIGLFPTFGELLFLQSAQPAAAAATESSTVASISTEGREPVGQVSRDAKPEDHTALFRLRHGRAASAKTARCRFCHSGTSESQRDACQDCHAVMRPQSHTVRWSSTGHGRLAASAPARCATCHEIDWCSGCHSITPDSHFPLGSFLLKHNRLARSNPRSCMTCHSFASTCSRCHSSTLAPGGPTRF